MGIYLDHAATTAMSEVARAAYLSSSQILGNPSSLHGAGRGIRNQVELAREEIADLLGAYPSEIIFTAGGTEANNLAIKGGYWSSANFGAGACKAIITSSVEHHAVLDPAEWLAASAGAVHLLAPVLHNGQLNLAATAELIEERKSDLALISIMAANNETGAIMPISEVVKLAGDIAVHSDLVQAVGAMEFDFAASGLTSASISAHKIGGPVGIGALILKRGLDITPVLHGGGQERGIRSGTINAAGVIAFAAALRERIEKRNEINSQIRALRDQLAAGLAAIPDLQINTLNSEDQSLPGILNVTFTGTINEATLLMMDRAGIFASAGSACTAGVNRPSHVLLAMGRSEDQADATVRFSIGRGNTAAEISYVTEQLPEIIELARAAFISTHAVRAELGS